LINSDLREMIKTFLFYAIRKNTDISSFTGLIFCGYGDEEIYPSLIPLNVSFVLDNRIRYYTELTKVAKISDFNDSQISPFAQTDVIDTVLTGVDPGLENYFFNNFELLLNKFNKTILDAIGDKEHILYKQIENLDTTFLKQEIMKMNQDVKRERYILPLMNAVGSLSIDDLAELAESLIYLTSLKRRITFSEESVGGPVDVAVISKGDGFIWMKRKHYFKADLNAHYFENYFKKGL
jgi:hypothetical protein